MFLYCAKYFENYDFFPLNLPLPEVSVLPVNGNVNVLNLGCDGRLMLTVPADAAENLASVRRDVTVSHSLLAMRIKSVRRRFRQGAGCPSQVLLVLGIPPAGAQGCTPQLSTPQHRGAPAHDSAPGPANRTDVLDFLQLDFQLPFQRTLWAFTALPWDVRGAGLNSSRAVRGWAGARTCCCVLGIHRAASQTEILFYFTSKAPKSCSLLPKEAAPCFPCFIWPRKGAKPCVRREGGGGIPSLSPSVLPPLPYRS